jgi:hypothetical protein
VRSSEGAGLGLVERALRCLSGMEAGLARSAKLTITPINGYPAAS